MPLTRKVDGREVELTAEEETAIRAKWAAAEPSIDPADYPLRRWQFHAMLEIIGKAGDVDAAIAAIPDATERAVAKAKLAQASYFDRNDPLFAQLASAVGMTDAEVDAAWLQAKDLT